MPDEQGWFVGWREVVGTGEVVGAGEVVHECEPGVFLKTPVLQRIQGTPASHLSCSGCGVLIPPVVKDLARISGFPSFGPRESREG